MCPFQKWIIARYQSANHLVVYVEKAPVAHSGFLLI